MIRARGFTLLEVLVAMAIFGIIGLGANQMLRTVMTTHERAQAITDQFGDYTRAMMLIERDVAQILPRPVRDEYGEPLAPVIVGTGPYLFEFTRTGWNNPLELPRSNEQRVAYNLDADGQLLRYVWLVLDRAEDSEPYSQVLLTDINDFRVNVVQPNGAGSNTFPELEGAGLLPAAVEIIVDTDGIGELRRVIPLVMEPMRAAQTNPAANGPDAEISL